ncbi:MAG: glycosyltransferase [Candidatus Omnitrophota bacterium]|jgi:glycosyltransferase involved in cell wall biosynthesis|nr:MAG: glycosyltransferase [Candidatus Omnitrophota bacterium]
MLFSQSLDMAIKILHINNFFFPFVAGPSKHMIDVIRFTFSQENHSVVSLDRNDQLKEIDEWEGIPVRRFSEFPLEDARRYFHLGGEAADEIRRFVEYIRAFKPTCVVLYFIGVLPLLIRCALPEIKMVFLPFGFETGDFLNEYRTPRIKIALCGDGCYKDYISEGALPDQMFIMERPINTRFYTPLEIPRDPYRLLFVGRFHPVKRIPAMINTLAPVFSDHSKLHLHIVADTNTGLYSKAVENELACVHEAIKKNELADRVIFRGKKVGEDLLREYSEASIHLLPSKYERRATVVQEAITMGMQCINTCKRACDWPEYAEDGRRLIHYVDEVEDMIPTLRELLEQGSLPSNRDYALKHWSWDIWKPAYEKLMMEW